MPPLEIANLADGVAHACVVPLIADARGTREMFALLSPLERVRAARFAFERDRRTFVMSHGILRSLLGTVCRQDPAKLRFRQGLRGKPYLEDAPAGVQFNLSHCEGFCLVGISLGPAIGVDIERVRQTDDMPQLVRQCFSAAERLEFAALPPGDQMNGFFNGWTRKEAFVKAIGDGLSYPLEKFDVTLAPGRPARLLAIGGSETAASDWTMDAFEPAPGVRAAVAVGAPGVTVQWHALSNGSITSERETHHGRRTRGHDHISRGDEPRRTVFNLAGRP